MRVSVFGLGYVGCVTAAWLAKAGHDVIGVDANPEKVAMIDAASPPVLEPGLGEVLADVVAAGRLRGSLSIEKLVAHAEVLVVANTSHEAERALAVAGPQHVVIDLTRGAIRRRSPASPEGSGP